MTPLEERLRAELREESGLITPDSIVALRLPGPAPSARRPRRVLRRRGPQHWQQWGKPLAAAAAVAAVIVGTIAGVDAIPHPASPPATAVTYSAAPANYAYEVVGASFVDAIAVRSTATGKLLATVRPPRPYNNIGLLTSAANGTVFAYAAIHLIKQSNRGNWVTDPNLPMAFEMFHITKAGRIWFSPLSLPEKLIPAQLPSIALSPDGSKLALTYHSPPHTTVVQVITPSTGSVLRWTERNSSWQPFVQSQGTWTADGRTFAVGEPSLDLFKIAGHKPQNGRNALAVHLFSITAQGTRLTPAKSFMLGSPSGEPLALGSFLTPDGNTLIVPTTLGGGDHPGDKWHGEFAMYSSRTGTLRSTTAPWIWTWPPQRANGVEIPWPKIAWSSRSGDRLIMLMPTGSQTLLGVFINQPPTASTFTPGGVDGLPPYNSPAYRELETAMLSSPQLAW